MRFIQKIPIQDPLKEQLETKQRTINAGGTSGWSLSKEQKSKLARHYLLPNQKQLCCYCEKRIDEKNNRHIEHFIEQNDDKSKMYDYENLFLSCEGENDKANEDETSCGHKKTAPRHKSIAIDYTLLLNPSDPNTQNYIQYNDDGTISENKNRTDIEQKQAIYTIQRLNLDNQRLNNDRRTAIIIVQKQIQLLSTEETEDYITKLLDENQTQFPQFYSALQQNFDFLR